MKLFISGSPRAKTCYNLIKDIMTIDDAFLPLKELNIRYCMACDMCKQKLDSKCVMQDDMENVYDNIDQFDKLIFVSPVYFDQITALTKNFIERLRPFYPTRKLYKKKVVLILAGEIFEEENREVINNIENYFKSLCECFEMEYVSTHYFNPDESLKSHYINKIMEIKEEIYKD